MILSDRSIRRLLADKTLSITPIRDDQIQPGSVDITLGSSFRVFGSSPYPSRHTIDPLALMDDMTSDIEVEDGMPLTLAPAEFALGTTVETVWLPDDLVARVEGVSSLGRLGLLIHATAGFVDPGFCGQITLELSNVSPLPIKLWPGMRIGQLCFEMLDQPAERPYGHPGLNSKYQGQQGPIASRYQPAVLSAPSTREVGFAAPSSASAHSQTSSVGGNSGFGPSSTAVAFYAGLSADRRRDLMSDLNRILDTDSDVAGPANAEQHAALLGTVHYLEALSLAADAGFRSIVER